jgi:hypothetical protein
MKTEQEYKIEISNHVNFYQTQKDVALRLGQTILERYYDEEGETDFDNIVRQEVEKEVSRLNERESIGKPNLPDYYRANSD